MAVAVNRAALPAIVALGGVALFFLPAAKLPAFYESFLYIVLFWVALATSWNILGGYAHYLSFGHGTFFGAGVYTTATLTSKFNVPFLWTLLAAAAVAALIGAAIGAVVFRLERLRGDLFALLTLAVAFVVATIVLNTPIDGGPGVYLSSVPVPDLAGSQSATIYVLGLAIALFAIAVAFIVAHSRLGMGLFAIYDDEDVAEAKGVPTFRYKMIAFALSAAIAGAIGGVHAIYVGYVTVGETFGITIPVYVVLMSVLGGLRHWLGPAVGATLIAASLYAFTSGETAVIGRAGVALALILVILLLPEGVVSTLIRLWRDHVRKPARRSIGEGGPPALDAVSALPAKQPPPESAPEALACRDVHKSFGGIQALRGVSLALREGEILGLVGPNGSGKTTLINVISGHYRLDAGDIALAGRPIGGLAAHRIAALGIARTYQIPRPFAHFSALDNVVMAATFGLAQANGRAVRDEALHWLEFAGLSGRAAQLPKDLNLNERKFLEFARALAARPKVLMLDEVLAGLTPVEIDGALALIRRINARGTAILFVEHNMRAVLALTHRLAVLNYGEIIAMGRPREVVREPRVVTAYLGPGHA